MADSDRSSPTDGELVDGTLRGDRCCFDALIERYQKLVYSIAYRIVDNHTDADDLVQTIFLRAYSGLKTFIRGTDFKTWLYTIAVNTSLNTRKQTRRQREVVLQASSQAKTETMPETSGGLAAGEMKAGIERAIAMLPDEQRIALLLRIRDGLTHDEIAKICGCPPATITSRLFLARKKLEGLLREFIT
jgi:RNA polymerase sigma-70 factor (ECF subfamily)